jgi:hypothetical protein
MNILNICIMANTKTEVLALLTFSIELLTVVGSELDGPW